MSYSKKQNKFIRYCESCGLKMKLESINARFDSFSGVLKCDYLIFCPKKKWYNRHTSIKTDEFGDELTPYYQ